MTRDRRKWETGVASLGVWSMAELYAPATGSIKQEKFPGLFQEPAILLLVSSFDTEVITAGEIRICYWILGDLSPGMHLFFSFLLMVIQNQIFIFLSIPFLQPATETSGLHNYTVLQWTPQWNVPNTSAVPSLGVSFWFWTLPWLKDTWGRGRNWTQISCILVQGPKC